MIFNALFQVVSQTMSVVKTEIDQKERKIFVAKKAVYCSFSENKELIESTSECGF